MALQRRSGVPAKGVRSEAHTRASIRTANHVKEVAIIGADVATAPPDVIKGLVKHPLTDKGLAQFLADWEKTGQKIV